MNPLLTVNYYSLLASKSTRLLPVIHFFKVAMNEQKIKIHIKNIALIFPKTLLLTVIDVNVAIIVHSNSNKRSLELQRE